jgi:hypothetical protein
MVNNCKKCGASLVVSTIIESFYPNSDAEKSSLKVGDKILEINKIPVDTNADILAHEQVNGLVSVKVERKNQKLMFLVPDSDGFFTDQITYKEICKNCEKKKRKRKIKNFFDKIILGMFCLLVVILFAIVYMLVTANKIDDDIPESAESFVAENLNTENTNPEDTQEILLDSPEQKWEKIEQLLRSSNVFENEILYLALNSEDYALFDTVLQNEYAWRKI